MVKIRASDNMRHSLPLSWVDKGFDSWLRQTWNAGITFEFEANDNGPAYIVHYLNFDDPRQATEFVLRYG